MPSIL